MLSVTSAALLLFFVMDPLGNVPLFLSALRGVAAERHRVVIVRELVIALGVLVVFLFFGPRILAGLHVSGTALTVAGGVVLLLIALRMVFPSADHSLREEVGQEPFVVPLAIPYVAGPSALATVLLLTSREPDRWLEWLAALVIAWMASGLVLFFASGFARVLGSRGLLAAERLMGMLLVVVSVEMILSGLRDYLAALS